MTDQQQTIFTVINHHHDDCPHQFTEETHYVSYFVGEHGDQWIFVLDYETREAYVTGGDVEWEMYPVTEGESDFTWPLPGEEGSVPSVALVLCVSEVVWLMACWLATQYIRDRKSEGED
jgi:hypothetical protein